MAYGEPLKFKYPFTDSRHELIYEYLSYLQRQEYQPGIDSLIRFLTEGKVIAKAGGEAYVRYIFRGIEGDRND
jgi:hypothetical protein